MSDVPGPPGTNPSPAPPPGTRGAAYTAYPQKTEGRPVSFYLAIFLALLLFVSGGLNLLLLFVSAVGSATAGFSAAAEDDGAYEVVAVGGDSSANTRILRVSIRGAIAEEQTPIIGAGGGTVSQVRRALRFAARESSVGGVLFDIDSPGGGVTDSDEIWRLIHEFKEKHGKPVLALLGDIAASGGYYVAVACDRIVSRETTITGSIGVILSSFEYGEGLAKLGVKPVTIVSERTPFKDMMSPTRPMTEVERLLLVSIVDEMYDRFVDVVDRGRPDLTRDQVLALANGRIYSAKQALDAGLVDAIGNIEDAYAALRDMMKVDVARVVEYRRRPTLGELLFGARSRAPSLEESAARLLSSTTGPRLLYFWQGGR